MILNSSYIKIDHPCGCLHRAKVDFVSDVLDGHTVSIIGAETVCSSETSVTQPTST
jgi:hypothetical protein